MTPRPTREAVSAALLALVQDTPGFVTVSRRLKLWGDVPGGNQPALFLVEHDEEHQPRPHGLPGKVTLGYSLIAYWQTGQDPNATPAMDCNTLLDAIVAALQPPGFAIVQTLGGVVDHCWIEGRVIKDPGDLDGQGLLIVPVRVLIP